MTLAGVVLYTWLIGFLQDSEITCLQGKMHLKRKWEYVMILGIKAGFLFVLLSFTTVVYLIKDCSR